MNETNPEILKYWIYEKNEALGLDPLEITKGSSKKAWFYCPNCKKELYVTIKAKLMNNKISLCKECGIIKNKKNLEEANIRKIKETESFEDWANRNNKRLLDEWSYDENNKNLIYPNKILKYSKKRVYWKCKECSHIWDTRLSNRVNGDGCPKCAKEKFQSFPEKVIFYYIHKIFKDAISTYKADWLGKSEIDIYIPSLRLGIEYDGQRFHRKDRINLDIKKDELVTKNNIKLIRIREPYCPDYKSESIKYKLKKYDNENLELSISFIIKYIVDNFKLNLSQIDINIFEDLSEINKLLEFNIKENSVKTKYPEHANLWDYEKNGKLTPDKVTYGSRKKVWLKCPKCNDSYLRTVNEISKRNGYCKKCNNRKEILKNNKCITCGSLIKENQKFCSQKCLNISRQKVARPSRDELKNLVRTTPFTTIAKQFGVSDKSICKWCIKYHLPSKSTEIKKYTDEEWIDI